MSIAPFSFREFSASDVEFVSTASAKPFLPNTGRKKEEAPPPPPPPPTFSEDDLKAAERDGYQKGFLDGVTEGKNQAESEQATIDLALTEAVSNFAQQYTPLFNLYRQMLRIGAEEVPKVALAIAKKIAGEALAENAYKLIEDISMRCVQTMMHEPKLTITLHASMQKALEEKLASAARSMQLPEDIKVVGDPDIAPPNCRIEWKNGAMLRDTDALWQQVEQVVAGMVASCGNEVDAVAGALENPPEIPKGE
jgi:flagellar assembly protein FliH